MTTDDTTQADSKPITAHKIVAHTTDDLDMLTSKDTCELFKIGQRTLRAWRRTGKFPEPDLAIGNTIRWRRITIEAWLTDHRQKAESHSTCTAMNADGSDRAGSVCPVFQA